MIPYSSSNMNKDEGTLIPIYDGIYYKSSYTVSKSSINYVSFRITPNIDIDSISIIISRTSSGNSSITLILVFFVLFLIIFIFCLIFLLCKLLCFKVVKSTSVEPSPQPQVQYTPIQPTDMVQYPPSQPQYLQPQPQYIPPQQPTAPQYMAPGQLYQS